MGCFSIKPFLDWRFVSLDWISSRCTPPIIWQPQWYDYENNQHLSSWRWKIVFLLEKLRLKINQFDLQINLLMTEWLGWNNMKVLGLHTVDIFLSVFMQVSPPGTPASSHSQNTWRFRFTWSSKISWRCESLFSLYISLSRVNPSLCLGAGIGSRYATLKEPLITFKCCGNSEWLRLTRSALFLLFQNLTLAI